jgi:hypothetical protein
MIPPAKPSKASREHLNEKFQAASILPYPDERNL